MVVNVASPAGERLLELEKKGIVDVFKAWSKSRNKILVCPSSQTVTYHINGISQQEWEDQVVAQLKEYTDRPSGKK